MACLTRRSFVSGLITAAGVAGLASILPRMKFGRINAHEHGSKWRVWLDGKDVSDQCYEADDQAGYVKLFKQRNGKPYYDREINEVARCVRTGDVRIERE